ncbi:MarR family transcriptional regulator [Streptomyces sp. NPDC091217]|uniref:LexA family protein n=1 Tax=Streptomyces sp. NPDC091217 TaxID=3365975 RepID=UPI0037F59633
MRDAFIDLLPAAGPDSSPGGREAHHPQEDLSRKPMPNDSVPGDPRNASPDTESTDVSPPRGLSSRQLQILNYLRKVSAEQGFPPTTREIADAVGLRSPSSVSYQLDRLEKLGLVDRVNGRFRGRVLSDAASPRKGATVKVVGCPLLDGSSDDHDGDKTDLVVVLKVPLDRHVRRALRSGAHLTIQQLPVADSDSTSVDASVMGEVIGITHPVSGTFLIPAGG